MNDAKRKLIPALATLGGTLAAGQAIALEIGPINVQSTLGEPLRASIAYALGPNEELAEYCVSLRRAVPGGAIPAISRATISIDKGLITITGATALREPLATVALDVSCPYTPKISREYMLMIDPGSRQTRTAEAAVQPPEPAASAAAVTAAAAPASRSDATSASSVNAGPPLEPLFAGDRLLVAPGHTLSLIVAAVGDREVDYAEAATRIVAANPEAFVDGDPDRLEAGSWLSIPDLRAAASAADYAPAPAAASVSPQRAAAEPAAPAATDEPETRAAQARSAVEAPSPAAEPAAPVSRDTAPPPAEVLTSTAPNAGLIDDTEFLEPAARPDTAGDGAADAVTAEAAPEPASAPDSVPAAADERPPAREVAGTTIAAAPPAQPVRRERDGNAGTSAFWYWLIGGGAAIIAGLLALLYRSRRSTDPAAPEQAQPRPNPLLERVRQAEGIEVEPIQAFTTPDFNLGDDSPTAENPTLDTGTVAGSDLDDDGAIAAELASDSDQHTHQDVDINLGAVRYEDTAGDDDVDAGVDVDLADDEGDDGNDDVDLDLASGSGFDAGQHTQVDENFTFAATTALDFELPDEDEAAAPQPETDIIPPLNIEQSSILKSEVLPDEDDDYDMSVILDATKQPDPSEVTEKDLHAVVVDAGDNTVNSGDYTVARDPDFDLLEQDYEDELSATQALNMEIERAALELKSSIDDDPTVTGAIPALGTNEETDIAMPDDEPPTAIASLDEEPEEHLTEELPTRAAEFDEDASTAIAHFDEEDEFATDVAGFDEDAPTAIAAFDDDELPTEIASLDDAETAVAPLDDEDDFATDVDLMDEASLEAALTGPADDAPTAVAPLDEDDGPPTAIIDEETIDAALTADDDQPPDHPTDQPTAIAPLDDDEEPTMDFSPSEQTSIESQLAHLSGETTVEAANDDALLDDDADPTGINAALESELTEDDKTVEIAHDDEEPTIRLSREDNDDTVEMPPRSKNA